MTTMNRLVRGAFDQGQVPTIACFSQATVALGVDLDRLLGALQKFVDRHLAPVWGTPAKLVRASGFVRRAWAMVFLDDADVKDALAYHDLTPDGLQIVYRNGRWTQIHGSKAKARRFAAEDRRGHRGTYRGHPPVRRSAARWGKVLATYATHPAAPLER